MSKLELFNTEYEFNCSNRYSIEIQASFPILSLHNNVDHMDTTSRLRRDNTSTMSASLSDNDNDVVVSCRRDGITSCTDMKRDSQIENEMKKAFAWYRHFLEYACNLFLLLLLLFLRRYSAIIDVALFVDSLATRELSFSVSSADAHFDVPYLNFALGDATTENSQSSII